MYDKHKEREMIILTFNSVSERDSFIENNINLIRSRVIKINKQYDDDLFQIGLLGMSNALDHFDENHGYAFSTYATKCIDRNIWRHINKTKVDQNRQLLCDDLFIIDKIENNSYDNEYDVEQSIIDKIIIDKFITKLNKQQKEILILSLKGLTQLEISKIIGISRGRVSIIKKNIGNKYNMCREGLLI